MTEDKDATDLSQFKSKAARQQVLADYDEALGHWAVPVESGSVTTTSGTTHYLDCGPLDSTAASSETPLVLLHGGGGNATMWGDLMPRLAKARPVVALDILGDMGRSVGRRPADGPGYVGWLLEVLDALDFDRVHLCGASYGGWMASLLAAAHSERVERLAMLGPPHLGKMRPGFLLRALITALFPSDARVRRFYRAIASPSAAKPPEWALRHFIRRFQAQRSGPKPPPLIHAETLAALPEGTLILVGRDEPLFDPVPAVERLRAMVPHVQTEWVEGAGHTITVDRAEWMGERLETWLG